MQSKSWTQRELRDAHGLVTKEELGICGSFGYVFGQDPRPNHRLVLTSVTQAESQRESFVQTVSGPRSVMVESNVMVVM